MTANRAEISVLHIDDEPDFSDMAAKFIERQDERITVKTALSASEGLDHLSEKSFDCIVSDYDMPNQNGIEFLEAVREDYPELPFILYTGKGSEEIASEAISAGVTDYLQKEVGTSQYKVLAHRISNAVDQYRSGRLVYDTEQKLSQLAERTDDILFMFDSEWSELLFINSAYEEVWNRSIDELEANPRSFLKNVHPEDQDVVEQTLERILEGKPTEVEHRLKDEDGVRWIYSEANPVYDDDGNFTRIVGFVRDITERKEREQALREEQHFIDTALDTLADIFYVVSPEGEFLRWNDELPTVSGYTDAEIERMNVLEFFEGDDIDRIQGFFDEVIETGEAVVEADLVTKDGQSIPYSSRSRRLHDPDGELIGIAGISRDISDRKTREKRLERQKERLEEFARIVSHDLRNPLTVAQGRLELVREDQESEDLEAIARALERMDVLIEDLLTDAQAGEPLDDVEQVNLDSLAKESWQTIDRADARLDADTGLQLEADRSRLKQLLENLLRNAIEHGGDDVTISLDDLASGFYLEDDSRGIPESIRDDVFTAGFSTYQEGTGYGLSIVNDVAEAHGWDIQVSEGSEGGARFEITGVESAQFVS